MNKKFYVLLDAMAIQAYIFATNKLKIIRGSSLGLAYWQRDCRKCAAHNRGMLSVSAGGNVLAGFDCSEDADKFRKECCDSHNGYAPAGMEIAWACVKGDNQEDSKIWKSLQREIACYKAGDREAADYPPRAWPEIPGCQFCGIRPDDNNGKVDKRKSCLCCRTLYELGERSSGENSGLKVALDELDSYVRNKFPELSGFSVEMEALVKPETDGGDNDFLAAVVIDLNNMGDRIKGSVTGKGGSFEKLQGFSEKLADDIFESVTSEVAALCEQRVTSDKGKHPPIIPLVLAGDDLIFLLPGRLALEFAKNLLTNLNGKGYPACAGVALAKVKFPVNRLVLMAESLCANAKQEVRFQQAQIAENNRTLETSCALDWHLHQESSMIDPLTIRRKRFMSEENDKFVITTDRPYMLDEFEEILADIKTEDSGKALWGLSNRKLFTLYDALCQGPEATRKVLKYIFLRREAKDMSLYKTIWEKVEETDGEYPLFRKEPEEVDYKAVHSTDICDRIEVYWLAQGPQPEEAANE